MKRPYTLLLAVLLCTISFAQGPVQVLEFTCSEELPPSAEKYLRASIQDLDPEHTISIQGRSVKVRVLSSVHPDLVLRAMDDSGVGHFAPVTRIPGDLETDRLLPPQDFPVRVHSEDPLADDKAYQDAKQAWMKANPERYREMVSQGIAPVNE
jgi:hypothetical protein